MAAEPPLPTHSQGHEVCVQGEAGITSPQVQGYVFRQGGTALVAVPEGRCIAGSS